MAGISFSLRKGSEIRLFEMLQAKLCVFPKFTEFSQDMFRDDTERSAEIRRGGSVPYPGGVGQAGRKLVDGQVHVPECFHRPYKLFCEAGWNCMSAPPEFGGQGLPFIMRIAAHEWFMHNFAFSSYPGLGSAAHLIHVYGTEEQKQKYLPKMNSIPVGRHDVPDRAERRNRCRQSEHQGHPPALTAHSASRAPRCSSPEATRTSPKTSLLHPVLAHPFEGDPAGTKGISIFIVPKYLVNSDRISGQAQRPPR